MIPFRGKGRVAGKKPDRKSRPNLPLDRVFAVADKSGEFQGLFELFKEYFDAPAGLVETGDRQGGLVCRVRR